MEKDIFKSILCDKLEKAVSHKYVERSRTEREVSNIIIPKRKENQQAWL